MQQLLEAISQGGFELEPLLVDVPDDVDEAGWKVQLSALEQKISRIEPVNLAALQDRAEQNARNSYLDSQVADLGSAMKTLESAIKKIGRETKHAF